MFCRECGKRLPDGVSNCPACGADVIWPAGSAATQTIEEAAAVAAQAYAPAGKSETEELINSAPEAEKGYTEWKKKPVQYSHTSHAAQKPDTNSPALRKIMTVLSYVAVLPVFLLSNYLYKGDAEVRFHAREGAKLFVSYYVCLILLTLVAHLGVIAKIAAIAAMVFGMRNAAMGNFEKIPGLDRIAFLEKVADKLVR